MFLPINLVWVALGRPQQPHRHQMNGGRVLCPLMRCQSMQIDLQSLFLVSEQVGLLLAMICQQRKSDTLIIAYSIWVFRAKMASKSSQAFTSPKAGFTGFTGLSLYSRPKLLIPFKMKMGTSLDSLCSIDTYCKALSTLGFGLDLSDHHHYMGGLRSLGAVVAFSPARIDRANLIQD